MYEYSLYCNMLKIISSSTISVESLLDMFGTVLYSLSTIFSFNTSLVCSYLLYETLHSGFCQFINTLHHKYMIFNTRHNFDLYRPQANLTVYQRGPYYFGIKLFNYLPLNIKELANNNRQFRIALSTYLHSKSFYTLNEYINQG
jgi:hypothetical protein